MKITKAVKSVSDPKAAGNLAGYDLIQLEFSDGTKFSIFPESLGFPRIYAHDLLDEYLEAGGKLV
jgi:hypothetical protein